MDKSLTEVVQDGTGVSLPAPADIARRARIQKVLNALQQPGVNTIVAALEVSGVQSGTFYRDIKHPDALQLIAEAMDAADRMAAALITTNWLRILHHQIRVANGDVGSPRDSTPAARFVAQVLAEAKQDLAITEETGQSEASRILQKFKERAASGDGRIIARRITEEIEVEAA